MKDCYCGYRVIFCDYDDLYQKFEKILQTLCPRKDFIHKISKDCDTFIIFSFTSNLGQLVFNLFLVY